MVIEPIVIFVFGMLTGAIITGVLWCGIYYVDYQIRKRRNKGMHPCTYESYQQYKRKHRKEEKHDDNQI